MRLASRKSHKCRCLHFFSPTPSPLSSLGSFGAFSLSFAGAAEDGAGGWAFGGGRRGWRCVFGEQS